MSAVGSTRIRECGRQNADALSSQFRVFRYADRRWRDVLIAAVRTCPDRRSSATLPSREPGRY
jgi:hypothetical protein